MSTLVTGGAGFIGSNLVEELLAAGEDVVVLDNMHTGSPENLNGLEGNLKLIQGSCNDLPGMDLHPESIYHLGIPSSSPMYKKNPYLVGEALNGFTAVFELAKKSGSRVVYASSSSLYNGLLPPHREDMTIRVADYYTEARLAMERMAELYKQLYDIELRGHEVFLSVRTEGDGQEAVCQHGYSVSLGDARCKDAHNIWRRLADEGFHLCQRRDTCSAIGYAVGLSRHSECGNRKGLHLQPNDRDFE